MATPSGSLRPPVGIVVSTDATRGSVAVAWAGGVDESVTSTETSSVPAAVASAVSSPDAGVECQPVRARSGGERPAVRRHPPDRGDRGPNRHARGDRSEGRREDLGRGGADVVHRAGERGPVEHELVRVAGGERPDAAVGAPVLQGDLGVAVRGDVEADAGPRLSGRPGTGRGRVADRQGVTGEGDPGAFAGRPGRPGRTAPEARAPDRDPRCRGRALEGDGGDRRWVGRRRLEVPQVTDPAHDGTGADGGARRE